MADVEITDSLLVKDLRKALPRRDPRSRPLDLLLAPDAIPVAPDVSGAKVGLREARRALRFDTELRIAVLLIAYCLVVHDQLADPEEAQAKSGTKKRGK